jgi:hypothetical protein
VGASMSWGWATTSSTGSSLPWWPRSGAELP